MQIINILRISQHQQLVAGLDGVFRGGDGAGAVGDALLLLGWLADQDHFDAVAGADIELLERPADEAVRRIHLHQAVALRQLYGALLADGRHHAVHAPGQIAFENFPVVGIDHIFALDRSDQDLGLGTIEHRQLIHIITSEVVHHQIEIVVEI